jgi:hypothetical protein
VLSGGTEGGQRPAQSAFPRPAVVSVDVQGFPHSEVAFLTKLMSADGLMLCWTAPEIALASMTASG